MVSAQLSHLLWNSLQCVACFTSLPAYGTFAKHVQMKNGNVINRKKKKKSNNLKWPHSGGFLIPWSFSNSNRKVCQFCAVAKLVISKQVSQTHSCMVLCRENYNSYSNQQPASKYYLLPVCPPDHLFFLSSDLISQTKLVFVGKVTAFFVYKVTVYRFFLLYQKRLLNDNSSLLRFFKKWNKMKTKHWVRIQLRGVTYQNTPPVVSGDKVVTTRVRTEETEVPAWFAHSHFQDMFSSYFASHISLAPL